MPVIPGEEVGLRGTKQESKSTPDARDDPKDVLGGRARQLQPDQLEHAIVAQVQGLRRSAGDQFVVSHHLQHTQLNARYTPGVRVSLIVRITSGTFSTYQES